MPIRRIDRRMCVVLLLLTATPLALTVQAGATGRAAEAEPGPEAAAEIGAPASDAAVAEDAASAEVELLDLSGQPVDPFSESDAKATVFLFARTDCPISNRYAPTVRTLHERFSPQGVEFWLVYLDRDQPIDSIREHLREFGYPFNALRDLRHELVRMTGATVTPEAAVFVPGGRMVYRGRIDDRYVAFGKTRPAPTRHDLADALTAVLEGRAVETPTMTAIGCFIPDLQ